jgi:hypothetical protein
MAGIIAIAATVFLVQQWRDYRDSSEAARLISAMTALLRTTEQLAVSRGPDSATLLADDPASPASLAAIAKARGLLASEVAGARVAFLLTSYPERDVAIAHLDKRATICPRSMRGWMRSSRYLARSATRRWPGNSCRACWS